MNKYSKTSPTYEELIEILDSKHSVVDGIDPEIDLLYNDYITYSFECKVNESSVIREGGSYQGISTEIIVTSSVSVEIYTISKYVEGDIQDEINLDLLPEHLRVVQDKLAVLIDKQL